jgi:trehalose-phosphatase
MKHLFKHWKEIEALIRKSGRVALLADYDGTLTPIVSRPQDAVMTADMRRIVKALSGNKRFKVGVVSGRGLKDVKKLVRLKGLYYAGNHGFEIKGPGISYLHPALAKYASALKKIKKELKPVAGKTKGSILEDKGASLSLHYRLVKDRDLPGLKAAFRKISAPYAKKKSLRITSGKKVWEVRIPVKWHKGCAVSLILKKLAKGKERLLPMYLGDDTTDEDAFKYLKGRKSLTVFVGKKTRGSAAGYYARSPKEIKKFLTRLSGI